MKKYYEKLNLEPGASLQEVKKAYRVQVKVWHPDRFPSISCRLQEKAHEKLREINEAYKKLELALKAERAGSSRPNNGQPPAKKASPVTLTWPNGDKYIGESQRGLMHGLGTYFYSHGDRYAGEFRNGKPDGQGTFFYSTGDVYCGAFKNEVMEGGGTYLYSNGGKYTGEFKDGKPHGIGSLVLATGREFIGNWVKGEFFG